MAMINPQAIFETLSFVPLSTVPPANRGNGYISNIPLEELLFQLPTGKAATFTCMSSKQAHETAGNIRRLIKQHNLQANAVSRNGSVYVFWTEDMLRVQAAAQDSHVPTIEDRVRSMRESGRTA